MVILCLERVNGSNNGILRVTPQILSSRHHGGALVLHSSNIARATRRPRHRHAPLQIPLLALPNRPAWPTEPLTEIMDMAMYPDVDESSGHWTEREDNRTVSK